VTAAAARRFLPTDLRDFLRSIIPLALLALAAISTDARLVVLILLVLGTTIATRRGAPVRWAWAAAVPVAVSLTWGLLTTGAASGDAASCPDPAAPLVVARVVEAILVLGVLATLAMVLGASRTSLALRWPARRWVRWAVVGFLVAGPLGLLLGPWLARPFFGDVGYALTLAPLVPAAIFAVANGVMEEVAYRGALLNWSARVVGIGPAVVGQAIVFGLAHSGADVIGWGIPLTAAMGVGGLLAGVIAVHTRSLLIPIAVHVGFDLPLYLGLACSNGT
jgi:membrane protease YdiL (CAAX protease family)